MAQLQVPIHDELMTAAKTYALKNGMTLKELVRLALELYTSNPEPMPEPEPKKQTPTAKLPEWPAETKKEEPKQQQQDMYILRKTAKVGRPLKEYTTFNAGPFEWSILAECKAHFDADGKPIPIRYTDWDGNVQEPDEEELIELATALGKPVKIEE